MTARPFVAFNLFNAGVVVSRTKTKVILVDQIVGNDNDSTRKTTKNEIILSYLVTSTVG